jgi:hypothetical protein
MDITTACEGDGNIFCQVGVEQKKKVIIDSKKSKT